MPPEGVAFLFTLTIIGSTVLLFPLVRALAERIRSKSVDAGVREELQLQLLPHASIDALGADAFGEGAHEREQQYGRPNDGQREEKGHSFRGHRLPRRREPLD